MTDENQVMITVQEDSLAADVAQAAQEHWTRPLTDAEVVDLTAEIRSEMTSHGLATAQIPVDAFCHLCKTFAHTP